MSDSDRYAKITLAIVAATVFIFMAGTIGALLSDKYAKIQQTEAAYQKNAKADRNQAQKKIANVCYGEIGQAFSECVANELESYYEKQATNEDLKAQKGMALWAMLTFFATFGAIIVASIAAWFAWQQVFEARRIGEAQTRAYLATENIDLKWLPNGVGGDALQLGNLKIAWRNDGLTPARKVRLTAHMVTIPNEQFGQPIEEFSKQGSAMQFGPAALGVRDIMHVGHARGGDKWLSCEETSGFMNSSVTLIIWTGAKYVDIFDRPRFTEECYQAHYFLAEGDENAGVHFSTYPHHNKNG